MQTKNCFSIAQEKCLELASDADVYYTHQELADRIDVRRETVTRWHGQPEFLAELRRRIRARFRDRLSVEAYRSALANVKAQKEKTVLWILENWEADPPMLLSSSADDKASLFRDKKDFARFFLAHHFSVRWGEHHERWLAVEDGRGRLEAIAAPRGSAKTTFTLLDILYAICYRTEDFIVVISETKTVAEQRLMDVRYELESNEKLRNVFGVLVGSIWKQDDIICSNGIRIVAQGRGGQIRGSKHGAARPSLIILDDVESSESVLSPVQREKVWDWYHTDVRRAGRTDGTTNFRVIGTYLHPDALLPQLVENPSYRSQLYKAVKSWHVRDDLWQEWRRIATDLSNPHRFDASRSFYRAHELEMLEGVEMLWPEGISYLTVQEAILSDGLNAVLKEFQNEFPSGDHLFDMEKALRFRVDADGLHRGDGRLVAWDSIVGASLFLDWAGGKDTIDNCYACAVVILWESFPATREAYGYLVDCWMDKVALSKQIAACFDLHDKYSYFDFRFAIEDFPKDITGAIHESVRRTFDEEKGRRNANLVLSFTARNQNKIERIAALEPYLANGWLSFNEALPQGFMDQFIQFPTGEYVDGPDATEGAFQLKVTKRREVKPNGVNKPFKVHLR